MKKRKSGCLVWLVVLLLVIGAFTMTRYLIVKQPTVTLSPTQTIQIISRTPNATPTPVPTPTPSPTPPPSPTPTPLPEVLLVNKTHSLPDGYTPDRLIDLYGLEDRAFKLSYADMSLTEETYRAANEMFLAAKEDGVEGFTMTSAFRTTEKQQEIYDSTTDGTAALPGQSEHQTGLAFDVTARRESGTFADTPQYAWLIEHCWDYGFILRYPAGKEDITGFPNESWHYRYVGKEIAAIIREHDWTLEEYCENR